MRVGIIGAGTIAKSLFEYLQVSKLADVAYILVSNPTRMREFDTRNCPVLGDPGEALKVGADLIVEAAVPGVVTMMAAEALHVSDFCAFSCTALSDAKTEASILAACSHSGRRFFVPHGAVLALDGIRDGRELIDEITITTTKSAKSLGLSNLGASGVVAEGSARDVCQMFPRNVNVHAAVALAGIGFDRTRSRVIVEPGLSENRHRIDVSGQGFTWTIEVSSPSLGGVTGAYTPQSAVGSLSRILEHKGIVAV